MQTKWFQEGKQLDYSYIDDDIKSRFMNRALEESKEVFACVYDVYIRENKLAELILLLDSKKFLSLLTESAHTKISKDVFSNFIYLPYLIGDDSCGLVSIKMPEKVADIVAISISMFSLDKDFIHSIDNFIESNRVEKPKVKNKGIVPIKTFGINPMGGISIDSIGSAKYELVKTNYIPRVLEEYNFVLSELPKNDPFGKIVIMDGPPGTGKTRLITSLIGELYHKHNVDSLVVNANLIERLLNPEVLPALIGMKNSSNSIVIVLEDADAILSSRQGSNMKVLSDILNLSDGIIGSVIDLRIIASTNSPIAEIDPALKRPGRLCKRISVDLINDKSFIGNWINSQTDVTDSDKEHMISKIDELHIDETSGISLARLYELKYQSLTR